MKKYKVVYWDLRVENKENGSAFCKGYDNKKEALADAEYYRNHLHSYNVTLIKTTETSKIKRGKEIFT